MNPVLLNIYGPLSIHAYGVCIAIGGLISFYLFSKDKKIAATISDSTLVTLFQIILIAGFIGGRAVCILSDPAPLDDPMFLFKFWEPGLSILGTIITTATALTVYLYIKKIPFLLLLDRMAIYIPIAQSFGRLGCFFAGCCYGLPTTNWLSVTYTHANHLAPLHCALHPAQLYSSFLLFLIFLFLYVIQQHRVLPTGVLFCSYLILVSTERFLIDFIRWDRVFFANPLSISPFSVHQWIALSMCLFATLTIVFLYRRKQ